MKLIIHRGTHEIGGTCIELIGENSRILIDAGSPLDDKQEKIPDTLRNSLRQASPPLKGILISHPHLDHYGLLEHISHDMPVFAGRAASVLMGTTFELTGGKNNGIAPVPFKAGQEFSVGDFTVKPYLVDHSGFDSYAFLIKCGDKSIFYSGDFRNHGRKGKLFESFLKKPPQADVLLLEGTMIGTEREGKVLTEAQLEEKFTDSLKEAEGAVFVTLSSQNIDRIVTLFRACKKTGRLLVIDPYTAEILRLLQEVQTSSGLKCHIPQAAWEGVHVCYPQLLCRFLKKINKNNILERYKKNGRQWSYFSKNASKVVMLARSSSLKEIFGKKYFDLSKSKWIYSIWSGYLKTDNRLIEMDRKFRENGASIEHIHTSGHADIATLKKLAENFKYNRLIPIHTSNPELYEKLFRDVMFLKDGEALII